MATGNEGKIFLVINRLMDAITSVMDTALEQMVEAGVPEAEAKEAIKAFMNSKDPYAGEFGFPTE